MSNKIKETISISQIKMIDQKIASIVIDIPLKDQTKHIPSKIIIKPFLYFDPEKVHRVKRAQYGLGITEQALIADITYNKLISIIDETLDFVDNFKLI